MTELAAALIGLGAGAVGTLVFVRNRVREVQSESEIADTLVASDEGATVRVLRALPFAAFVFDRDGYVTFFNGAAESLFGVDASRAYGRALIEVVPSVEFEKLVNEARRGVSATRDVRIIEGDRERIFGITVQPLEGEAQGAIAIAVDRTALVSIERVRRDFVSNVSHELRTPLAAIKLMVETVLAAGDDAEARALFLPQVDREVDRMVQLVEDLLELARSESGRFTLRKERFDLTDVARSVVNTFAQRAAGLDVSLQLRAPQPVFVNADRDRLMQVAVNVVDNALRHTPARGSIEVEMVAEDGCAVLRVRDTGSGIPFNDLPHIFERFYVVDRSRSRGHSGTGLGLSIAKRLVEAHDGMIVAESVFGAGATLTCRLPLAPGDGSNIKET